MMPVTVSGMFTLKLAFLEKRFLQKRWVRLVERTIYQLGYDGAGDMAASLSYYALLSVFPLLIGIIAILGFVFPSELVQKQLFNFVETQFPASAGLLQDNIMAVIEMRGKLGLLSVVMLLWSGGALFASIGRVANRAWGIQRYRPFYFRKFRDFILAVGTGVIFFISLGLNTISAFLLQANLPFGVTVTVIIMQIIAFLLIFSVFLLIYKYMPNFGVSWQDIWPGALLAAVLFEVIRELFSWYLIRFANFQLVYGSIASVIAFLVWIYLSAFVLIIGIEFSSEHAKMKGSRLPE